MKLRPYVYAVAGLAAASALVYFLNRPTPPPAADVRIGQPLLARDLAEKAAQFRLSDQGKTLTLLRQPDGTWRNTSYYDLPASLTKLAGFIGNLVEAHPQRLVTTQPERLARLEFKDTRVELLDGAGQPLWSVTLGKSAETGGRFVRFGTENKGYLANLNAWLDADAKNWAEAQLLDLKPDTIAQVTLPLPASGEVVLQRARKEDAWTAATMPAGQRVKTDKITSLLATLGTLRFSDTRARDDAEVATAQAHTRSVKLTTFDGRTVVIALGRKPEEKRLKAPANPPPAGNLALPGKLAAAKPAGQPLAPEMETIPAGPVFVAITHSDPAAPVNALMPRRAFQVAEYVYTSLPKDAAELFEPAPAPVAPPTLAAPGHAAPAPKP